MAMISVSSSAIGIASHTPITFKNFGRTKSEVVISPNVRKKDIAADTFPFDSAVNIAEVKILPPENRKLNEKTVKPFLAISKTFSLFFANIFAMLSSAIKENRNTKAEMAITTQIQIRTAFFSCLTFSFP